MLPQSGEETAVAPDAEMHQENTQVCQNVTFMDRDAGYSFDLHSSVDPTRRMQDTTDAELANFFSRPVRIASYTWNTAANLSEEVNPWNLFFTNPRVINRMANFNLLRAKLKVKVVINGNGFFYSRAMMAYQPLPFYDYLSKTDTVADLVQISQLPHIFIDPCTSTGGEMTLPFFYHENYLNIPEHNWNDMGQLIFRSFTPLKHANGSTASVNVSVFAWAEDVELSVLTSKEPILTPQSGSEVDQANAKGTISGLATAVASIATAMQGVPEIGPFAKATAIAATATAAVAKLFGFSRPSVTKNPEPYRPTVISSLAVCNTPDTSMKLTVDDKQELTIDPRIAGLGGIDPLGILDIAKRESYLNSFVWQTAQGPDTHLWNARVSPVAWQDVVEGPTEISTRLPACAVAALPFGFWTGTIKYRFQIMASAYHKGRLMIKYDPKYNVGQEYNVNYMKIVDISEEQDFTIAVTNCQERTLLEHHIPGLYDPDDVYSTTEYSSEDIGNGTLGVYILNKLTTPQDAVDNNIVLNVFISVGDDFEVYSPDDLPTRYRANIKPQMGMETNPDSVPSDVNAPVQTTIYTMGPPAQKNDHIDLVYAGEKICSFRTLLKRYTLHSCIYKGGTGSSLLHGRRPHFPMYRGYGTSAVHETASLDKYNYFNTTLLNWITLCFSGYRGSIRYKIIPAGKTSPEDGITVTRTAFVEGESYYDNQTQSALGLTSDKAANVNQLPSFSSIRYPKPGLTGQALTVSSVNGTMEFESPYITPYRFVPGKKGSNHENVMQEAGAWDYRIYSHGDSTSTYKIYVAAGEDFQTYFWTGMPPVVFEGTPPA